MTHAKKCGPRGSAKGSFRLEPQSQVELTKEEVVCIWTESSNLENLDHVEKLAMDITDHGDRSSDVDHIALLHQQFLGFEAYGFDYRFGEQFFPVQAGDTLVEIDTSCKPTDQYTNPALTRNPGSLTYLVTRAL